MEKVWNSLTMEIDMKVAIQMESHKAKETIIGVMVQYIRDNLKMDSDLEQAFGNLVGKNMKELMSMIREMVTESILGEEEAFIKEILFKTFGMDTDKCIGIMSHFTKGSGFKVHKMGRDKFGRRENLYKKASMNLES